MISKPLSTRNLRNRYLSHVVKKTPLKLADGWLIISIMYLKRCSKKADGQEYGYWAIVESVRTARGPRQRVVANIYPALLLWQKLGFSEFCKEQIPEGREATPWSVMACILTVARFCAPSSELRMAESWYDKTALDDLSGVPADRDRLYRALDSLLPHKNALCGHLQDRYGELFDESFDCKFNINVRYRDRP